MSLDDRWVHSSVDKLVEDTLDLCRELFEIIVEDVRAAAADVVVEGFQLLPELVSGVGSSARHALFLVATPEFRRATHFSRPHAWTTPLRTSDPERAQRNRLERDDRVGEHILNAAEEQNLKVIVVDGSRNEDDIAAEGEAHLAGSRS